MTSPSWYSISLYLISLRILVHLRTSLTDLLLSDTQLLQLICILQGVILVIKLLVFNWTPKVEMVQLISKSDWLDWWINIVVWILSDLDIILVISIVFIYFLIEFSCHIIKGVLLFLAYRNLLRRTLVGSRAAFLIKIHEANNLMDIC